MDNCSIETFAGDGGQYFMPVLFDPLNSTNIDSYTLSGSIKLGLLSVLELNPIWAKAKP